jgi:hypothetical protein
MSGEGEIRTPGTLRYAGFQDQCIRPLCHLSEGRVVRSGRIVENFADTSTTQFYCSEMALWRVSRKVMQCLHTV